MAIHRYHHAAAMRKGHQSPITSSTNQILLDIKGSFAQPGAVYQTSYLISKMNWFVIIDRDPTDYSADFHDVPIKQIIQK